MAWSKTISLVPVRRPRPGTQEQPSQIFQLGAAIVAQVLHCRRAEAINYVLRWFGFFSCTFTVRLSVSLRVSRLFSRACLSPQVLQWRARAGIM